MKSPCLIRKMDDLGRIVIPSQLRKGMDLQPGDTLELYMEEDRLVLQRFSPACVFCGGIRELMTYQGKNICARCVHTIKEA